LPLANANVGQGINWFHFVTGWKIRVPALRLRHLRQQFTGSAFCPHADFRCIADEFAVLRLPGVGLRGHGFVADVLYVVNPACLSQCGHPSTTGSQSKF
jgi:hypothetical protein